MFSYQPQPILTVKPSSSIRTDYKKFSAICHATEEAIIITNNGESDLVVMSVEAFRKKEAWFALQAKLASADQQIAAGEVITHDELFGRLRERMSDE